MKYFTRPSLIEAAKAGEKRGFNRQLEPKRIKADLGAEDKFPVVFSMLHEHIAGCKADPHMRVMIVVNDRGDLLVIDVDMKRYNELPEWEMEEARS